MVVDPQVLAFRDRQGGQRFPGYVSAGVAGARESARAVARWRAGFTEFDPVGAVEDRTVSTERGAVGIRVYHPTGAPTGVVTYFHGGGFVVGDLDTSEWHCRALCARCDAVVVSVDYALAPEHPFPAAVHQAHAAVRWVAEHLTGTEGSLPLAVAGDSAGASLATTSAMLARDAGGPSLAAQLLIYPMLDPGMSCPSIVQNGEGYPLDRATIEWFWGHYLGADRSEPSPLARPLGARLDGLAPAVVVTAGFDPFRDEGEKYATLLAEAGVPTRLLRYDSLVHGFVSFAPHVDAAQAAVSDMSAALRDLLLAGR